MKTNETKTWSTIAQALDIAWDFFDRIGDKAAAKRVGRELDKVSGYGLEFEDDTETAFKVLRYARKKGGDLLMKKWERMETFGILENMI